MLTGPLAGKLRRLCLRVIAGREIESRPVKFFESTNRVTAGSTRPSTVVRKDRGECKNLKGLILAQNERWRRGLGMQVGGIPQGGTGVRGSKAWVPTFGFGIAIRDGG